MKNKKKKFKLICKAGVYEASSMIGLIYEVLKHRTYHLIKDGKWMD